MPLKLGGHWRAVVAVMIPFIWLAVIRVSGLHSADNSHDAYYHIAMADRGPAFCMQRSFPQARLSVWYDAFSDKELGYHLILSLIRRAEMILGIDPGPPFHVPALFFLLLFLGTFVLTVRSYGADPLLPSLLMAAVCPLFTTRLLMLRPHLLAMSLMMLACWLFPRLRGTGDLWRPAVLGFAVAWSYSNPHFLLLPAVVYGAFGFPGNRRLGLLLPVSTAAGLAAGFVIHPQFPNTFLNWKIQALDVARATGLDRTMHLAFGNELRPPSLAEMGRNSVLFLLAIGNLVYALLLLRRRVGQQRSAIWAPLAILSLVTVAAFPFGLRAIEYACPFTLLAAAILLAEGERAGMTLPWPRRPLGTAVACGIAAAALVWLGMSNRDVQRASAVAPLSSFGAWARAELPAGTRIANLHWPDFALLMYSAPQYSYLYGLDPMFAYRKNPLVTDRLEMFRMCKTWISPAELASLTGSRLAFVSSWGRKQAKLLLLFGYEAIYSGDDGWLFRLPNPTPG